MQADNLSSRKDLRRLSPASTATLLVSLIFANKLWILDATSMSLYWVARLPIRRLKAAELPAPRQTARTDHSDEVSTVGRRRHRKIALSLAVVGALVAPFAFGTYGAPYTYSVLLPLTPQEKERATALAQSEQCSRPTNDWVRNYVCDQAREQVALNATRVERPDSVKNLSVNAGVAGATFALVFGLAYLIPALIRGFGFMARRYWKWLNA